jgi:hypothetical protein
VNQDNFPCTCGHPKDQHRTNYDWGTSQDACLISNESPEWHVCVYKPDNLVYLEQKYESSHSQQ